MTSDPSATSSFVKHGPQPLADYANIIFRFRCGMNVLISHVMAIW